MVGHDAPGFHKLVDAVANQPASLEQHWFQRARALDKYVKSLEARVASAGRANQTLGAQIVALLEEVRELNREIRRLHREREQA